MKHLAQYSRKKFCLAYTFATIYYTNNGNGRFVSFFTLGSWHEYNNALMIFPNKPHIKVMLITDFGQRQKFALNAENITDLPKTLQMLSLCNFS